MLAKVVNKQLNLQETQLTNVPPCLGSKRNEFSGLIKINLSGNQIQELDDSVCLALTSIEQLDLRNNRLKIISKHVKAMM